jgi:AbrB family looped-hinge helix DNA binding protein
MPSKNVERSGSGKRCLQFDIQIVDLLQNESARISCCWYTESQLMNVQRGKLVSGGRLQLPVEIRRALSLSDGDTVLIEVVDGEIHVRPYRDALARVQASLRKYVEPGRSLSEELIAERRAAADNE